MKILLAIIIVIAAVAGFMIFKNSRIPSTLGVTDGKLSEVPNSPNAVSSQTEDKDKRVEPFPFKESLAESKESIKKAVNAYGKIEIFKETENYIHCVSTTEKMHYHDDLEFYFDESNKRIEFRSASRVGYSDMGLNKKRYLKLYELYMN